MTVVMANGMPDVAVRDDENVARVLAERQAHYDSLLCNRYGYTQAEVDAGKFARAVICNAFPVQVLDDKENSFSL